MLKEFGGLVGGLRISVKTCTYLKMLSYTPNLALRGNISSKQWRKILLEGGLEPLEDVYSLQSAMGYKWWTLA